MGAPVQALLMAGAGTTDTADTIDSSKIYLLSNFNNSSGSSSEGWVGTRANSFTLANRCFSMGSGSRNTSIKKQYASFGNGGWSAPNVTFEDSFWSASHWCIDCDVYQSGANAGTIFCIRDDQISYNSPAQILMKVEIFNSAGSYYLRLNQSTATYAASGSSGSFNTLDGGTAITVNTWFHLRLAKYGGKIHMFLDGVEQGSGLTDNGTTPGSRNIMRWMYDASGVNALTGYIENMACLTGVPDIGNFTPPSAARDELARYEAWSNVINVNLSLSERKATQTSGSVNGYAIGRAMIPSSGKWYWEVQYNTTGSFLAGCGLGSNDDGLALVAARSNATTFTNQISGVSQATQVSWSAGRMMLAFDADAAKMWLGRAGTWFSSGDPANGTNPYYYGIPSGHKLFPWFHFDNNGAVHDATLCMSSGNLSYSAPSGFSLLV